MSGVRGEGSVRVDGGEGRDVSSTSQSLPGPTTPRDRTVEVGVTMGDGVDRGEVVEVVT